MEIYEGVRIEEKITVDNKKRYCITNPEFCSESLSEVHIEIDRRVSKLSQEIANENAVHEEADKAKGLEM